jgi:LPXTG-motif cell wall-anchored protein
VVGVLGTLALTLGAVGAATLVASPATATGDRPHPKPSGRCVTWEHGAPGPTAGVPVVSGGAQISTVGPWVRFTTPADDLTTPADEKEARARWTINPENFKLKDLKSLTYTTKIVEDGDRGSVAPAVRLHLEDGTTLVYEPYWNGTVANGDVKTWNVTAPGAKLWDNGAEPAPDETFADWVKPERKGNVPVKEISVGVGTYNEGADVKFTNLKFKFLLECKPLDVIVAQPTCDVDEVRVKFTNPNTRVRAWLWTSTDPTALRKLEPGASYEVVATGDVKYAYTLQPEQPKLLKSHEYRRQMTHKPGEWIVNTVDYVEPTDCVTTEPTTATPTTAAPTTAAPTTAAPTSAAPTSEVPVPAGSEGDGGSLAQTGAKVLLIGGGGIALLVGGVALLLLTRRRHDEYASDDTAVLDRIA